KDRAYFAAIDREMETGGLEAMLYDLMHMAIPDWIDLRNPPKTEALIEQVELSGRPHEQWWQKVLQDGEIAAPGEGWNDPTMIEWPADDDLVIRTKDLQDAYQAFARGCRGGKSPLNDRQLGNYLRDVCAFAERTRDAKPGPDGRRAWVYRLPSLESVRRQFTDRTGIAVDEGSHSIKAPPMPAHA